MDPAQLLGIGGTLGAIVRYAVDRALDDHRFPFSTVVVNVVGSFVLGLIVFGKVQGEVALFVGGGACGAFTTYSSFSVQTVRLWETGDRFRATLYGVGMFGLSILAAGAAAGLVLVVRTVHWA